MADLAQAIRILAEHVGMSADSRRRLALALDDPDPRHAIEHPPPDPRDAEIARLRAELEAHPPRIADDDRVTPAPRPVRRRSRKNADGSTTVASDT